MKKKILVPVFVLMVIAIGVLAVSIWYYAPYNSHDVSRYPCIMIDETEEKQYICENSNYTVYTVHLKDVYFIDKDANKVGLKEAFTDGKMTIEDMIRVCGKKKEIENVKVYQGENYQIILNGRECLIAPKDYEISE